MGKFKKSITILEAEGKGNKIDLSTLDDIYGLESLLKERVKYLTQGKKESTEEEIEENDLDNYQITEY